jgi:hypothetical protein
MDLVDLRSSCRSPADLSKNRPEGQDRCKVGRDLVSVLAPGRSNLTATARPRHRPRRGRWISGPRLERRLNRCSGLDGGAAGGA